MKNKKGFSWIELLVVIAIVGIFAGFLLPAISNARKQAQEKKLGIKVEIEFPTEKILTISAADYCESAGRKLSDYKIVGVWSEWHNGFQKAIPTGTEVVVGFIHSERGYAGTALIPLPR